MALRWKRAFLRILDNASTTLIAKREARKSTEEPKVIFSRSWRDAFKRIVVHVVPILVTVAVLAVNVLGIFVGIDYKGIIRSETINVLLLQITAKIHEMLIVSSLGFIVFHVVRHELLLGDGLPLGLVGSGLSFGKIDYFFKKEFYGSVWYWPSRRPWRKYGLLFMLLACGLIATLAGPSSAVLLVPRVQSWPAGRATLYLNGTSSDLWPSDLSQNTAELSLLQQSCQGDAATTFAACPASGFPSLWEYWGRQYELKPDSLSVKAPAQDLSGSIFYWPITSPTSPIPPRYALGNYRDSDDPEANTFVVLPHAASSAVLSQAVTDWWEVLPGEEHVKENQVDDRNAESTLLNTFTSTRCSSPQHVVSNDSTLSFPTIQGRFDYAASSNVTVSELSKDTSDHIRFTWISLPNSIGPASIGAVLEGPWSSDDKSRSIFTCTIQSGWIRAQTKYDAFTFWTGWYPWNLEFGSRLPSFHAGDPSRSNGRIALGTEWLELLTPKAPFQDADGQNGNATTIEKILENASFIRLLGDDSRGSENTTRPISVLLEAIISSVVADGLSRSGLLYQYPANVSETGDWTLTSYQKSSTFAKRIVHSAAGALLRPLNIASEQLTELDVRLEISGMNYRMSTAEYLSTAVLISHMLLALAHIGRILWNGRQTSSSWTLISEYIALAQNSRPVPTMLDNTGAGIRKARTFASVAKIVAVNDEESAHQVPRAELVFLDEVPHDEGHRSLVRSAAGKSSAGPYTQGPRYGLVASTGSSEGVAAVADSDVMPLHESGRNGDVRQSIVPGRAYR